MLTCTRLIPRFCPNAHHHGSLPQQLGVVWDRLLKTDPEGPTLISHAAYPHDWSVHDELLSVCACSTLKPKKSNVSWRFSPRRAAVARRKAAELDQLGFCRRAAKPKWCGCSWAGGHGPRPWRAFASTRQGAIIYLQHRPLALPRLVAAIRLTFCRAAPLPPAGFRWRSIRPISRPGSD